MLIVLSLSLSIFVKILFKLSVVIPPLNIPSGNIILASSVVIKLL